MAYQIKLGDVSYWLNTGKCDYFIDDTLDLVDQEDVLSYTFDARTNTYHCQILNPSTHTLDLLDKGILYLGLSKEGPGSHFIKNHYYWWQLLHDKWGEEGYIGWDRWWEKFYDPVNYPNFNRINSDRKGYVREKYHSRFAVCEQVKVTNLNNIDVSIDDSFVCIPTGGMDGLRSMIEYYHNPTKEKLTWRWKFVLTTMHNDAIGSMRVYKTFSKTDGYHELSYYIE